MRNIRNQSQTKIALRFSIFPMFFTALAAAAQPVQTTATTPAAQPSQYAVPNSSVTKSPFKWPAPTAQDIIVTTANSVDGFKVTAYRGLVEGVSVREPTGTQDLSATLQGMFGGGNIDAYGQLCEQGRVQAYNSLIDRAKGMGANAVIGTRFDTETFSMGKDNFATAAVCYGTAVVIEPMRGSRRNSN